LPVISTVPAANPFDPAFEKLYLARGIDALMPQAALPCCPSSTVQGHIPFFGDSAMRLSGRCSDPPAIQFRIPIAAVDTGGFRQSSPVPCRQYPKEYSMATFGNS
jgi:hypothetical protein